MDLVDIPPEQQWDVMAAAATVAEGVGFDSVWVYDHFHTVPVPTQESTFEAWTAMAGLAAATETVRLGQMCTANSYRSPAYLAKVTSCVDVMSGGRLEVGIGAGWYEHEYLAYGYDFPKASVRISQLDEAVQVMLAMWTEDEAHFKGEHYRVDGAINRPKPLQDPHPPLWIAGGGEQLTLRVVAKYGAYANFFGNQETWRRKAGILEQHCEAVGRDFSEITLTGNMDCLIAETEAEVEEKLANYTPTMGSVEDWRKRSMVGTPEQVIEQLAGWREEGMGYSILYFIDATWGDGMRLFGEHVIPALR